jgi:hypothetical protein
MEKKKNKMKKNIIDYIKEDNENIQKRNEMILTSPPYWDQWDYSNWEKYKWKVINLETGEEIKYCRWVNEKTGEYEAYITDKKGKFIPINGEYGEEYESRKTEIRKGKIKLINRKK